MRSRRPGLSGQATAAGDGARWNRGVGRAAGDRRGCWRGDGVAEASMRRRPVVPTSATSETASGSGNSNFHTRALARRLRVLMSPLFLVPLARICNVSLRWAKKRAKGGIPLAQAQPLALWL
jgi:hypothetical protein